MEALTGQKTEDKIPKTGNETDEYRETIRRLISSEMKNAIDEDIRNATKEILEEQRKAVRQIVEEHRQIVKQVVEDEKKAVWDRAKELRKAILKLGIYPNQQSSS